MGTPLVVMTIGGSDSGAGAGIQADLKTLSAQGCFATTVVTAVTAQNTREVAAVQMVEPAFVRSQVEALLNDIPPQAVKTGWLGNAEIVQVVAEYANRFPNLVVDPVLVNRAGEAIVDQATVSAYLAKLIPSAALATPNFREAVILARPFLPVGAYPNQWQLADMLANATGTPFLVTGGRLNSPQPIDVLSDGVTTQETAGRWVLSHNVHGTGDALSSSIAARLAHGSSLLAAVAESKAWVARAVAGASDWQIGSGEGPIDHFGWA